jgi:hypothetical protein
VRHLVVNGDSMVFPIFLQPLTPIITQELNLPQTVQDFAFEVEEFGREF